MPGAGNATPPVGVAYLPFAAPNKGVIRELPAPADYRTTTPAVLGTVPADADSRLFTRKRVVIGLAVAVALHAGLGLAWWLAPPLRLKAGYAPERWVPVVPLITLPRPVPPSVSDMPHSPPTPRETHDP